MCVEHWLNDTDWWTRRKACFNVISSTTNPTWTVLEWSRDLHGRMPASTQSTPWHSRTQYFSRNGHDDDAETTILDRSFHSWPQPPYLTHRNDNVRLMWHGDVWASSQNKNKGKPNRARVKNKKNMHHAIFLFLFSFRET